MTAVVHFDSTTRPVIDGHKLGFCKLIADLNTAKILGCHIIGERAVDIAEVAAITIAAGMRVDELARIPLAYPTYASILARAAVSAAQQLNLKVGWQAHQAEGALHRPVMRWTADRSMPATRGGSQAASSSRSGVSARLVPADALRTVDKDDDQDQG